MAIKMRHRTTTSNSKEQLKDRINACNLSKLPRTFSASVELPKPQDDTFTLLQRNYRVRGVWLSSELTRRKRTLTTRKRSSTNKTTFPRSACKLSWSVCEPSLCYFIVP